MRCGSLSPLGGLGPAHEWRAGRTAQKIGGFAEEEKRLSLRKLWRLLLSAMKDD